MKENINTFKSELIELLEDKLDPGYFLRTDDVTKNNNIQKTGLSIQKGIEELNISPSVYIEDLYDYYNGYNINAIADKAYEKLMITSELKTDLNDVMSIEYIKDNIYLKVIGSESNFDYLMDKPFINIDGFDDLVAVATIRMDVVTSNNVAGSTYEGSAVVTDKLLETLGISKKTIFEYAKQNSMSKEPYQFKSLREVLIDSMRLDGEADDDIVESLFPSDMGDPMYVLSNTSGMYGASVIMYDGVLEDVRNKLGEDYTILPSSIHELIIVKNSAMSSSENGDYMLDMVRTINQSVLSPSDILSNNIYHYSGADNSVTMIADASSEMGAEME